MSITIDKDLGRTIFSSVCTFCSRLHEDEERACDAFPEEIPEAIWEGENGHTGPYPGDHGLRFELRGDLAPGVGPG